MEYIELGSTGVQIPQIGLGTWKYTGGPKPLQTGIELGAFLIDTAEGYGTEQAVGEAVRSIRDEVFIATKVSETHFKHNDVLTACDQSLERLGTDHIDLYQLHWPNPSIPIAETLGAMDKLVDDGKVRFIGVSNFSVAQLKEAQSVTRHGIVANQVPYSLTDRVIEGELLPYCQENRVTVIAYSPLAQGVRFIETHLGTDVLREVADACNKTPAQVALNWCISKANVMAIPKSDSVQRTKENCEASGWTLTAEQITRLETIG